MLERVLKSISRYNMLPLESTAGMASARVIVAVSGGPDSVCLLHVLREVEAQMGATVVGVAHFNHKLRAEASDGDERFVAAVAASLGLPFHGAEACVEGDSECLLDSDGNLEQNSRNARRNFFARLIQEGECCRIALGHTRDDQAETVLFRLLRGSGLAGLAGIHPATPEGFIRPLIDVTRAEVENYLRDRGIVWREDGSNRDFRFARNRIRHGLLPQLANEWNPRIREGLAQLADLAFEEERYWESAVPERILVEVNGGVELRKSELDALPRAVARRVMRRAIAKVKGDLRGIEFGHIEGILDVKGDCMGPSVPGVQVLGSFGFLRIEPTAVTATKSTPTEPINVKVPGTYATFEGAVRLEIGPSPAKSCANLKAELTSPIFLRGWKPGDHYRPVGKRRDLKLKEMFQNARIPSWRRRGWPILESGGKILWARDFGAAEEFAAVGSPGPVLRVWDLNGAGLAKRLESEA